MSKVKRYDVNEKWLYPDAPNGEYMKFEDYEALRQTIVAKDEAMAIVWEENKALRQKVVDSEWDWREFPKTAYWFDSTNDNSTNWKQLREAHIRSDAAREASDG